MNIIDKMKTFELGETVYATMTAQKLWEGYAYTVCNVIDKTDSAGVFFDYEVQTSTGKILYIVNGHILFNTK